MYDIKSMLFSLEKGDLSNINISILYRCVQIADVFFPFQGPCDFPTWILLECNLRNNPHSSLPAHLAC